MPRFAVLAHDWPAPHFDLLLENEAALLTWRLSNWPVPISADEPGPALTAERIGDHRLVYLDYEGPVSGNRGHVRRVDTGTFTRLASPPDLIAIHLTGQHGHFQLTLPITGTSTIRPVSV